MTATTGPPLQTHNSLGADVHGQAALLLIEGLLHELIARSILSTDDVIEIVETAMEVGLETARDPPDQQDAQESSVSLLGSIYASLRRDQPQH